MTLKEEFLESVKGLPDNCEIEDLEYLVYLHREVGAGLRDLARGATVPHEEATRRFRSWRSSLSERKTFAD